MNSIKKSIPVLLFVIAVIISGAIAFIISSGPKTIASVNEEPINLEEVSITTFMLSDEEEVYKEDGKVVVLLFSTTWCPHCQWVKEGFNEVVNQYIDEGKIVAYHWELDKNDDDLTAEKEDSIPEEHMEINKKYNPDGYVPLFVIGNKYYRVGNGHEREDDIRAEKAELMKAIEAVLAM